MVKVNVRVHRKRRHHGRKLNKRQKTQVKTIIARRQELKYFSVAGAPAAVATNPALTATVSGSAFDIPQGNTDVTRVGDRFQWCGKIDFRLHIAPGVGATSQPVVNYRVIIFQWKSMSIAASSPQVGDILLAGPNGALNAEVTSQYNHDKRVNYHVILDKRFTTTMQNAAAPPLYNPNSFYLKRFLIPTKNIKKDCQLIGGLGQGTNRLFFMIFCDNAAVTVPTYEFTCKSFFRDS